MRRLPVGHLLFVLGLLLLLATAAGRHCRARLLLQVDNEPCPALLLVPLETSEVGLVKLIVRLGQSVSTVILSHAIS